LGRFLLSTKYMDKKTDPITSASPKKDKMILRNIGIDGQ